MAHLDQKVQVCTVDSDGNLQVQFEFQNSKTKYQVSTFEDKLYFGSISSHTVWSFNLIPDETHLFAL